MCNELKRPCQKTKHHFWATHSGWKLSGCSGKFITTKPGSRFSWTDRAWIAFRLFPPTRSWRVVRELPAWYCFSSRILYTANDNSWRVGSSHSKVRRLFFTQTRKRRPLWLIEIQKSGHLTLKNPEHQRISHLDEFQMCPAILLLELPWPLNTSKHRVCLHLLVLKHEWMSEEHLLRTFFCTKTSYSCV